VLWRDQRQVECVYKVCSVKEEVVAFGAKVGMEVLQKSRNGGVSSELNECFNPEPSAPSPDPHPQTVRTLNPPTI